MPEWSGHWYLYRKAFYFWLVVEEMNIVYPNPETVQRSLGMIINLLTVFFPESMLHSAASLLLHQFPFLHLFPNSWKSVYISCWQVFFLHHFYCKCSMFILLYLSRAMIYFSFIFTIAGDNVLRLLIFKAPSHLLCYFIPIMLSRGS